MNCSVCIDFNNVILKIARETGWDYIPILGEIRKLTPHKISRQTAADIIREAGLNPGTQCDEKTWDERTTAACTRDSHLKSQKFNGLLVGAVERFKSKTASIEALTCRLLMLEDPT
jgi:hypothetical protein